MDRGNRGWGAGQRRSLLVALVILGVAMLPALQPLLASEPTCGYDNAFHLWRAAQIDHLWDQGVLYSRWAPDMAHGFGLPLYLFVSAFPPAAVALLHRVGLTWSVALNAVFALGVVTGGYAMFWLAYRLIDSEGQRTPAALIGGVIAGTAYVYSPFQAYDAFSRGSLWEAFAWAFPPLLLLGVHEWSINHDRRFAVLGAAALGGMILSHLVFAFLFGPVFALWIVVHAVQRHEWRVLVRGVQVSLLGIGWTAFYWMPPFLEKSWVQTDRLLTTWVFDYRYNFLLPEHLLAFPRLADPRLLNDWPEKALGLVLVLLALLPLVGWRRASTAMRGRFGLLYALTFVFAALCLPVSLWLWDRVPLLAFVQFPWRYLGPAAFCVALLIGLGAAQVWGLVRVSGPAPERDRLWRGWGAAALPAVVLLTVMTANMGWFYPRHCAAVADTSMAALIGWERMTDTLGTTAKGEYLPQWIQRFPEITLDDDYAAGGPIVRLRSEDLPEGAQITSADYGATRARITLATPVAFRARYLAFYYPGWHVTIDGRAAEVSPEAGTGLVTFDVPAGPHRIEIRFGETPMRLLADSISGLSLIAVAVTFILTRQRAPQHRLSGERVHGTGMRELTVLGVAVAAVLVGKGLLVDTQGYLWRASRLTPERALTGLDPDSLGRLPAPANFGNQALLLGMDHVPETIAVDDATVLTLFWRALSPEARDWHVGLMLVAGDATPERDATRWGVELRPVRWARSAPPLIEWSPDDYARMDYHMDLPPGMPPGQYEMHLVLFDRATSEPASLLNASGNPVGPSLSLGSLTVEPPGTPPSLEALGVPGSQDGEDPMLQSCGPVGLWHAAPDRATAAPGEVVGLRTVWEALEDPMDTITMTVKLLDEAEATHQVWSLPPVASLWPTSLWRAGDRWTGRGEIRLPGSLESGSYSLVLALDPDCALRSWPLEVVAPRRVWALPAGFRLLDDMAAGEDALLGEGGRALVRLAGIRLQGERWQPGDTLDLSLAWEAVGEMTASYRVFVHILDEAGNLLDQNDGEPAGWTRPTTGWAVGEIVSESRPLHLPVSTPAGTYSIRVGLYRPGGARLTTSSGADGILIGQVTVSP